MTILETAPPPRCALDNALHRIRRGEQPEIPLPSGRTAHLGGNDIQLREPGGTEPAAGLSAGDVSDLQFIFAAWLAARRPWPIDMAEDYTSAELASALDDLPSTPDPDLKWALALEAASFAFGLHSAAVEEACRDFGYDIERHRHVHSVVHLAPRTWRNIRAAASRLATALRELGDVEPARCGRTDFSERPCVAPLRPDGTCIRVHQHTDNASEER